MSTPAPGDPPLDRRLLGIYLNDHIAGATAGTALARRARSGARSPELAAALDEVVPQIDEDHASLLGIMRRIGIPRRSYKVTAGRVAELAGRLKSNGRLLRRSPLTDLVEMEGLLMGIAGKESLWRTLRARADDLTGVTPGELDDLIARAVSQRATLERARDQVVGTAFGGTAGEG